jgi:N-acetylglutamate synthase-like GNAT family acetyltransferase
MQVRQARPDDAPDIQRLYQALVPGDANIHVDPARIAQLQEHATNHLFVLERDGIVCGTAFLTICLDAIYGFHPSGIVEYVVVAESARGIGGGRALLAAVEQEARAAGCTRLALLSTKTRVEAHAFFAHLGFDAEKKRGFVKYLNRTPLLPPVR